MDWLDYREKLGIGFDDEEKKEFFYTVLFNVINVVIKENDGQLSIGEYFTFCRSTGSRVNTSLLNDYLSCDRFRECISVLRNKTDNLTEFLAYYIFFVNAFEDDEYHEWKGADFKNLLCNSLEEAHIPYELMHENDKCFIFPKGAKELDDALVSEPLEWLKDYPKAHKTYCIALKQYSDGIYIRDIADNLRKALEAFLQEFLGNTQNLESNKNNICKYLGSQGVDAGITGLFQPLINSYKNINDRIVKHNDAVDEKLLEFLLYQTGVLIRMVLVTSNKEDTK